MKRLLASGCGSIYQICKAFRQGDVGRFHNPEFSILEWYRLGFDHHALMDEMDELLQLILGTEKALRFTYGELFAALHIDPHTATADELAEAGKQHGIELSASSVHRNDWLDLLMTHVIEPNMDQTRPVFIYDFPASHAALAKIRHEENPPLASRFEVYHKGLELANGFHELQDSSEQRQRFQNNLNYRAKNGLSQVPLDENFLAALQAGLPDCAGVALGIDRLILLALEAESISEVIAFPFARA